MEFSGLDQDDFGGKVTVWTVNIEMNDVGELNIC